MYRTIILSLLLGGMLITPIIPGEQLKNTNCPSHESIEYGNILNYITSPKINDISPYHQYRGQIFYDCNELVDADADTFTVIKNGTPYGTDKNYTYYQDAILTSSIRGGKTIVEGRLGDDSVYLITDKHVYREKKLLSGVKNTSSFLLLGAGYAMDDQHIYSMGQILSGADISSFTPISLYFAKDNYHVYKNIGDKKEQIIEYIEATSARLIAMAKEFTKTCKGKYNTLSWRQNNKYIRDNKNIFFLDEGGVISSFSGGDNIVMIPTVHQDKTCSPSDYITDYTNIRYRGKPKTGIDMNELLKNPQIFTLQ